MIGTKGFTWSALVAALCAALLSSGPAHASLARNAAGAKNIGNEGAFTMDTAAQFEREPDGKGWAVETGVQYQVTQRLQVLVEGMVFEAQQPDGGERASGIGDTDLTLSWLALEEDGLRPSVVLGAEAKLPTATHDELGTGQPDWSALLILGRERGELELSLEAVVTTFGRAGSETLRDQFSYTFTAEYGLSDAFAVYAEVFGNSAPTTLESRTDAARIGLEVDIPVSEQIAPYLSFEFDTEEVGAIRAGVEWTW